MVTENIDLNSQNLSSEVVAEFSAPSMELIPKQTKMATMLYVFSEQWHMRLAKRFIIWMQCTFAKVKATIDAISRTINMSILLAISDTIEKGCNVDMSLEANQHHEV